MQLIEVSFSSLAFRIILIPNYYPYFLKHERKKNGERSSLAARLIISDTLMCRAIQEIIDSFSLMSLQI
jgi:hypothetical protein